MPSILFAPIEAVTLLVSLSIFVASNGHYFAAKHPQPWKKHLPAVVAIISTISLVFTLTGWFEDGWKFIERQFQSGPQGPAVRPPVPASSPQKVQVSHRKVKHHIRAKVQNDAGGATDEKSQNLARKSLLPICRELVDQAIADGKLPTPGNYDAASPGDLPNSAGEFSCKFIMLDPHAEYVLRVRDECTGNPLSNCMMLLSISPSYAGQK
jgi:hypothetical protein